MKLSKKNIKSIGIALYALLFLTTSTNSFGQTLRVTKYSPGYFDELVITETTPYTTVNFVRDKLAAADLPPNISGFGFPTKTRCATPDALQMETGSMKTLQ